MSVMYSQDEAIAALGLLLRGPAVPEGFRLVEVRREGSDCLVLFRWRRNQHVFGIVVPWSDFIGLSTGEPVASAEEWASEVSWWLAEELDTGYVVRAHRSRTSNYIQLSGQGYGFDSRYFVSRVPGDGAWLAHCGWDVSLARRLRDRGQLIAWLQAYVNSSSGVPVVGQAVVARLPDGDAELAVLDVAPEVPDVVARDLSWVAVHTASDDGAARVRTSLEHSQLTAMGFRSRDDAMWIDTSMLGSDT